MCTNKINKYAATDTTVRRTQTFTSFRCRSIVIPYSTRDIRSIPVMILWLCPVMFMGNHGSSASDIAVLLRLSFSVSAICFWIISTDAVWAYYLLFVVVVVMLRSFPGVILDGITGDDVVIFFYFFFL